MGGPAFLAIFPLASPLSRLLTFSFILACVRFPTSTCRVDLSKTDTCHVSPNPKSLGLVEKAQEYGSVRCRVLQGKGRKGSFSQIFQIFFRVCSYSVFAPLLGGILGLPRTELSSATSPGHFGFYVIELGPQPSLAWAFGLPMSKWAWPVNYWAPQGYNSQFI